MKLGLLVLLIFGSLWGAGFDKTGIRSKSLVATFQSLYGNTGKGSWLGKLTSWGAKGYYNYGFYIGVATIAFDFILVLMNRSSVPQKIIENNREAPIRRNDPEDPRVDIFKHKAN